MKRFFSNCSANRNRMAFTGKKSKRSLALRLKKEEEEKEMYVERKGKPSSFLHKKDPKHIFPAFNVHPQTFPQTVIQSDGSTFTMRVCTPRPLLTLTKDTRNHNLWNPELDSLYDEKAAQVTKFAQKYGEFKMADLFSDEDGPEVEDKQETQKKKKK